MNKQYIFKKHIFKYKYLIFFTFILNLILWITNMSVTYITGEYVDKLVSNVSIRSIYIFSVILLSLGLIHILLGNVNNYFSTKLQASLVFDINFEVIQHVKKLPIKFFSNIDSVYLNQRINGDSNTIVNFFISVIIQFTIQIITFIAILLIFTKKSLVLTLLILGSIPVYLLMYFIFEKNLYKSSLDFKEEQNKFFSKMNKQLFNVSYIKLNSLFNSLDKELENYYPVFLKALLRYKKWNYYFFSVESILDNIFNVLLFIYGGISIYKHKMSIGDFIIIKSYYVMLLQAISNLTAILKSCPETKVSYNRILEILDEKLESNGNITLDNINSIELKNVNLKINNNHILNNFSYKFNKNNVYLIKGPNGAGKSTLIKLILGLYIDDFDGDILFNNINIKDLNLYKMRYDLISIIDQEPILIHNNLYKNITQNVDNIDLNLINSLMNEMNLFIDYSIDESDNENNSTHLSGGEKQKLSIIRAFIRNTDVIIMDEPTSALDVNTTSKLINQINFFKKDKIIIIVSHDERLDCICDKFIYL